MAVDFGVKIVNINNKKYLIETDVCAWKIYR